MSEESEVPSLRLKRPGPAGTPPPSAPASDGPAAPGDALIPPAGTEPPAAPRRRPSLTADPSPSSQASPESAPPLPFSSSVNSPAQPPASSPDHSSSATIPPAPGGGFKLKVANRPPPPAPPSLTIPPTVPPTVPSTIPFTIPPTIPADPAAKIPPAPPPLTEIGSEAVIGSSPLMPLPVLPPLPPSATPGQSGLTAGVPQAPLGGAGTRPPIHLGANTPAEALDPSKLPPPLPAARAKALVQRSGQAKRDLVIFALIFLVVLGAAVGGYFYFTGSDEAPPATPAPAASPARPAPTADPAPIQNEAAVPAPPAAPAAPSVPAPAPETPAATAPSVPPPPPPPPAPSARFVRYSESIRVSGVFQGTPARALVDGRLVRAGDLIEPTLGIKFIAVDAETKHLILEEASGARLRVKY